MMTRLLTACALTGATALASAPALTAQTVVLDFETDATSANYKYFGNDDLNETSAAIIDNPDATGANTSARVLQFEERASGQAWAGAYADPAVPMDLTTETTVCIDFWSPTITNVTLKFEGEEQTDPFWVGIENNTVTNAWEQLCFNTELPSAQGDLQSGAGQVWPKTTLFVGLDELPTENTTYYLDNLIRESATSVPADVTFSVDLSDLGSAPAAVGVAGTFNSFDASANPLTDDDGDGVFEGTFTLETGAYEYLFVADGTFESIGAGAECARVTIGGNGEVFANRTVTVAEATTLPTVAFGSCYAAGAGIDITFEVGTSAIEVAESGLYIAGGAAFGEPGQVGYRLTDDDGDGVYSLTIEREAGFTSYFTIANGACPDYSCKENLANLDCGDPDNFNDRLLAPVQQDTTLSTCFGSCETDTGACGSAAQPADVTVSVDMNDFDGEVTAVFLAGSFSGWNASATPMSDDDADGVYEVTVTLDGGTTEYKFVVNDDGGYEDIADGGDCVTGGFNNRFVEVDGEDITMPTVCFGSCSACEPSSVRDLTAVGVEFTVQPTVATAEVRLGFGRALDAATVRVLDVTGKAVQTIQLAGVTAHTLDVSALSAGHYLVELDYAGARGVQRVVKR